MESTNNIYSVSITLSPAGTLSGTSSVSTSAGQAIFSNLRILSAGTFNIVATCSLATTVTSSGLTITNTVYSLTVASSNNSPSAYFTFTVTVTLKAESNQLYTGNRLVTLSESGGSNISGATSLSTNTGTVTFSIYFTTYGSKTIVATCSSVTGNVIITVLEEMLKISLTSSVIIM